MDELGALIIGSIVAVVYAAFKLIERFIPGRNPNGMSHFTADDRLALKAVKDVITRVDGEGTPLTYFPRRLIQVMERQSDLMAAQSRLLEKMHDHLTQHENREEKLLGEMKELLKQLVLLNTSREVRQKRQEEEAG